MTIRRRQFLALSASAVVAPAFIRDLRAEAAVTLRLHHFLPASSTGHARFLKPWADRLQAKTNGRVKVDLYPAMQLGGIPSELFDQVRDGVVDLAWALPGATPNRFPSIEVFELPFVAARRAVTNSRALQDFAETHAADEFREVKPICFWAHDHGLIHAKRGVATLADLKGMKVRFPNRYVGEALTTLGADAVSLPTPQVPQALIEGRIEGCVLPWEVVPSLRVHELAKFHSDIPGSPTFYTTAFVLAMNRRKYEGLPAELRAAIDANSGQAAATMAGTVWDEEAQAVVNTVKKRGDSITTIASGEVETWRGLVKPVIDGWLSTARARGLDGEKLMAEAHAAIRRYDV